MGRQTTRSLKQAIRCAKLLVREQRLPRYLLVLGGIGLLPIPGPVDELVLLIVLLIVFVVPRHRRTFKKTWTEVE